MAVIFFGCSMRGGYHHVSKEHLLHIPSIIRSLGHSLSIDHQLKDGIIELENKLPTSSIHDRDYEAIRAADLGIFEISNASSGVGSEIADMLHLGKPVLCLYRADLELQVSRYVLGKQGSAYVTSVFQASPYTSLDDIQTI